MPGFDPTLGIREANTRAEEARRATLRTAQACEQIVTLLTEISHRLDRLERRLDGPPTLHPGSKPAREQ